MPKHDIRKCPFLINRCLRCGLTSHFSSKCQHKEKLLDTMASNQLCTFCCMPLSTQCVVPRNAVGNAGVYLSFPIGVRSKERGERKRETTSSSPPSAVASRQQMSTGSHQDRRHWSRNLKGFSLWEKKPSVPVSARLGPIDEDSLKVVVEIDT